MRARTTIDVDALATEVDDDTYDTIDDFDLNDMVENSGTAGIQTFDAVALQSDDLITTDSAQDWAIASAKSFKSGCVTGSVADTVRCDWINVHMDRLFATGDDDDIDLSALDAATDFVVYGWIATSSSELTGDYVAANL